MPPLNLSDHVDSDLINLNDRLVDSLVEAQKAVASKVVLEDDYSEELVGGVDQAFLDDTVLSGAVAFRPISGSAMEVSARASCSMKTDFPYIPGFLSFREGPAAVCAVKKLDPEPTLLFVDGCGINHPRMAGLASYIGVELDIPTIGVAKGILCGSSKMPEKVGVATPLVYQNHLVGYLLKSKRGCRPIVVAPGHKVSVKSSLDLANKYLKGHKLPEPIQLAHEYINQVKRSRIA